jgi:ABC-type nitrate/sulfonate/bicarbonate transport system permease component
MTSDFTPGRRLSSGRQSGEGELGGSTIVPKVIVVALVCFFPIVVNAIDGLKAVDPEMVRLMRTLGMSRPRIMRGVRVPSALPYLFSGHESRRALQQQQ